VTSSVAGQRESGLYSSVCKLLLFLVLLAPVPALAQGGRGGGSGGGGSAEGRVGGRRFWSCWGRTRGAGAAGTPAGTAGTAGNTAGGTTGGRIDGAVTPGPAMQGDDVIRKENSPDQSKADKKIKSICKGC
jgi:hypothetical protein